MPVVDASVVVDWVAPGAGIDAPSVALLGRLAAEDAELVAPRLLVEEVSNALLTGIRRGRWTGVEADAAHDVLRRLPIRLVDDARVSSAPGIWRVDPTTIPSTTCSTSRSPSAGSCS